MSHKEKQILVEMQQVLKPTLTIYTELIHNQCTELGLDPKKFWIDNALIRTYDYIRMSQILTSGVLPSSRQMLKP
jgi:hypothetical protein